jgi:hypothetical protein
MESHITLKNFTLKPADRLINSQAFKLIIPYLASNEKLKLRVANRKIIMDHMVYWTHRLKVGEIPVVTDELILNSFLTKSNRMTKFEIHFHRCSLNTQASIFRDASITIGS